jgi:poly(3-hydroxybutyrate) depolymerase
MSRSDARSEVEIVMSGRPVRELPASWPGRHPLGIAASSLGGRSVPIVQRDVIARDFGVITEFAGEVRERRVLLIAPLAGAYPILLRDLVIALLRHATVAVTDWRDPWYIPVCCGSFDLSDNIAYVGDVIRGLGPNLHVVGVCQGVIPALAATALLSARGGNAAPCSLTLVAGPVDPLANPTRVVLACRSPTASRIQEAAMETVPDGAPGAGRRIYPGAAQLGTFSSYLARHWLSGEIFWKLMNDDGEDPLGFPFWSLVSQFMNLPAELVRDIVRQVFIEKGLWRGFHLSGGEPILPAEIRRTGLMTIEGENDDIAGPGQTSAAHALCTGLPEHLRRHFLVPGCGHFALIHGARMRSLVVPAIVRFFDDMEAAG